MLRPTLLQSHFYRRHFADAPLRWKCGEQTEVGYLPGKGSVPANTDLKHAWVESDHIVMPFVSDTLGSMTGESAVALCMLAWCQAVQETHFFMEDWGDGVIHPTNGWMDGWKDALDDGEFSSGAALKSGLSIH